MSARLWCLCALFLEKVPKILLFFLAEHPRPPMWPSNERSGVSAQVLPPDVVLCPTGAPALTGL